MNAMLEQDCNVRIFEVEVWRRVSFGSWETHLPRNNCKLEVLVILKIILGKDTEKRKMLLNVSNVPLKTRYLIVMFHLFVAHQGHHNPVQPTSRGFW